MLETFILKNGLKVVTYSIPEMRSLFLGLSIKGGWIFDTPKLSGVAHFMEHLLVQGTPTFPTVEILSDFIEGLAGSYNAATAPDSIEFRLSMPAAHLEDALKIASEVFFEPLFLDEAIDREKGVIKEEIRQRQDTLSYKNGQFFSQIRFCKGHPFLLSAGGSLQSIEKITKDDLIKYWSKFFYPHNTFLVLVGGFDAASMVHLVEEYFGKYTSKKVFPGFPSLSNQDLTGKTVAIRYDPELRSCYLTLSFPSLSMMESLKERMVQSVIADIFGHLRRSRLFRLLRQQRGLVYDVNFATSTFPNFGYGYVSSQVAPDKLMEVIRLIVKELAVFVENGPTEEEVNFAKNYHINQILMHFDHPSAIANWIAGDLMWEDKIYLPEELGKIIRTVNTTDIKSLMQKYWDFAKLNLVVQGALEDSKANVNKFSKLLGELK